MSDTKLLREFKKKSKQTAFKSLTNSNKKSINEVLSAEKSLDSLLKMILLQGKDAIKKNKKDF